jgi:DNA-binding beta-propeller fold protein YncE
MTVVRDWIAKISIVGIAVAVNFLTASQAQLSVGRDRNFEYCFAVDGYEYETRMIEPISLAVDARAGQVYIADAEADYVLVISSQGVPKGTVGVGKINSPTAVAVDKDGNLYVAEEKSAQIKIIDKKGEVSFLEVPAREGKSRPKLGRMTFDRDGNLYVVDKEAQRILVFDKERKIKLEIGEPGDKRGQFKSLQDVAVDRQGRIYALDSEGTPVQVFDRKGKYVYRFGFRGGGLEDISSPSAVFTDQNDQVWIVDRGQHCLKVFDRSGTFLRKFGTYGTENGKLFQPVDADMDSFGRIYILEAGARRLQVFSLSRPFEPLVPMF